MYVYYEYGDKIKVVFTWMETNLEWAYNEQYTVCYVCIFVSTNNMIAFTFFQSKITLFSALFQKILFGS